MWTQGRQMLEQNRNFNDEPITENMQQENRKKNIQNVTKHEQN